MFSLNSVILPFVEIVVYIYCILTFRCACCFFKKNFFQQLEDPYFHSTSHVYIITFYSAWNLLSLYLIFLLFAVSLKWYSLTIILYLYNGMILFCFPLFFSLILSLKKKLQNCIFDLFQTCNVYTLFFFTCALILFGLGYRVTYRKCSLEILTKVMPVIFWLGKTHLSQILQEYHMHILFPEYWHISNC